jgi:hypothetical protein
VHSVVLTVATQGAYDASTGAYSETSVSYTGRAVFDLVATFVRDSFPDYVAGPMDEAVWLEGLTTAPKEGQSVAITSINYTIVAVRDVLRSGGLFQCIVRAE